MLIDIHKFSILDHGGISGKPHKKLYIGADPNQMALNAMAKT